MRSMAVQVWYALAGIWAIRVFAMAAMPFVDTSEPRYAEIARLMAVSGDWITPWFAPDVPFWGKPPLAFWAQALCIRVFGLSELSIRMASLPPMAGMLWLGYVLARNMSSREAAARWLAIFSTMLLPAAAAGAVLTDTYLAFAVCLCMTAFHLAGQGAGWRWRYGFFVGLGIGLLAKGPLAVVLVAGAIIPWLAWRRWLAAGPAQALPRLPWLSGILVTAALALPWYVAAEIKTPGFLRYFILGEHFYRFVDPGWQGDRYGSAHDSPYGSIWLEWLVASLPWGAAGLAAAVWRCRDRGFRRERLPAILRDARWSYLLAWALATPLFFTFAGNIIWTYVLPALPPVALLLATAMPDAPRPALRKAILACVLAVPLAFLVVGTAAIVAPGRFKTEKDLVNAAAAMQAPGETLYFVGRVPFSGRFYSRGTARAIDLDRVDEVIPPAGGRVFLAIPRDDEAEALARLPVHARMIYASKLRRLFVAQVPEAAH
ncbi:ArnT family glycosyltransferase [Bordetella bronchialis]|uniref:Dolichyl-phosphate-mannose--protein mannosyltransferase n=1 Tax=Bordetella bronchialis TaxID=463025 RepID=A0A193FDX1_9BORD|nr:glycosyltransferase family 39 protein [Bordetella bronchialis]ANN65972.1 dolichyl-phosphate-mannose--protein mannosyltransferase [Bordetella bronchialis]ANN71056.1 dolichyl-phosphate-mannose--protein mannosyltransferase [Bordetella bronchialis]